MKMNRVIRPFGILRRLNVGIGKPGRLTTLAEKDILRKSNQALPQELVDKFRSAEFFAIGKREVTGLSKTELGNVQFEIR